MNLLSTYLVLMTEYLLLFFNGPHPGMHTAWWRAETWDWQGQRGFVGAMTGKYKVEE